MDKLPPVENSCFRDKVTIVYNCDAVYIIGQKKKKNLYNMGRPGATTLTILY